MRDKQRRFVEEYLKDLNATQAAIRAEYKGDPNTVGPRLLVNVGVQKAIAARMKERGRRTEVTQDRVLLELARIAFADPRKLFGDDGKLRTISELDDDTAAAVASMEVLAGGDGAATTVKVRLVDKGAALTNAMRHLGMFAKDVLNVNVTDALAERLARARGRDGG